MRQTIVLMTLLTLGLNCFSSTAAEEPLPAQRRERAKQFHQHALERTGLLIPLYIYPANIHTNPVYNRVMDLKRRYETIPFWVIMNPATGPGKDVDANYTKAIDRLQGAGCTVLGYVSTSYGKRPIDEVQSDIARWAKFYPRTHGIFFDEMNNEDTDAAVNHQLKLTRSARDLGYWPTVANPGTDTPGRYFAAEAVDVIVIHETDSWPVETKLKGDYFGGYSDYPPWTRGVLVHSQPKLDAPSLAMARRYCRWIYVTDDQFRENDPKADNPWDSVSKHLEALCEQLAKP